MTALAGVRAPTPRLGFGRRAGRLVERNIVFFARVRGVLISGIIEPLFYLLGIGYGVGALVGTVAGPDGRPIDYTLFVAPGIMASSVMNGVIADTTFNFFGKLKWTKLYDALLATPIGVDDVAVGEALWAIIRGGLYATAFTIVMGLLGLIHSPLALLALPASLLIGYGFAGAGLAATTFMRKWQDFDLIFVVTLPLFLFSATFFPIDAYPEPLRILVALTPLYHGVEILRGLTIGAVGPELLLHAGYLVVMGTVGLLIATRRLAILLLR
jgi:lipooligosaccharide transport system permease protein